MTSRIWIGLLLLGAVTPAWSKDLFEAWKVETELGYMRPAGRIHQTFGGGFNGGLTLGRRAFSSLVAEGGVRVGDMQFSGAQTVTARTCIPVPPRGPILCTTGPVTQGGIFTSFAFGFSVPVKADSRGRSLQFGAGGLWGRYSITPAGDDLGSRSGPGFYVRLAGDVLPIGGAGGVGLLVRAARISTHGTSLDTRLPSKTSDTWLDLNLRLRIGPTARHHP